MISLKQINNKVVKAIPIPANLDNRPIKGYQVCSQLYGNTYLVAKKNMGKTLCVFKLLKECSIKTTKLIIFCSTIHKDENWIQIRSYFEKKGYDIQCYTSIYDDGIDQLDKLINELGQEAEEQQEQQEQQEEQPQMDRCDELLQRLANMSSLTNCIKFNDEEEGEKIEKKKRKSKYRAPEYIIVLDDISSELKSRSLLALLKKNRHYRAKIIISSQWVNDLLPESRKQLDLWLIFKGFPEKKMQEVYRDTDSSIGFELFYKIYRKATKKPYSFLYIDTRADQFRVNFNKQIIITYPEEDEIDDVDISLKYKKI